MIYTGTYRVDILEAKAPREAAQMVANGLAEGAHFPMTLNVYDEAGRHEAEVTVTQVEEVA